MSTLFDDEEKEGGTMPRPLGDDAAASSSASGGSSAPAPATAPPPPSHAPSSFLVPRMLSGSIGSIVTALAVTPLEVVKVRQQSAIGGGFGEGGGAGGGGGGTGRTAHGAPRTFRGVRVGPCPGCGTLALNNGPMGCVLPVAATRARVLCPSFSSGVGGGIGGGVGVAGGGGASGGTVSTLASIFRSEGLAGLYAGLRPTLVMSVPNTVLYFAAYDEVSAGMRRGARNAEMEGRRADCIPLVAGSSARLLASLVTAPLELVRTRQASAVGRNPRSRSPPGVMEEFRSLLRAGGVASLYSGLAPTLWRDVPFSALYWLFLERFKRGLSESARLGEWGGRYYMERGERTPPGVEALHAFMSGAAAGSIAAAFTTPFDVVKTRRQTIGQASATASVSTKSCDHFGLEEYPRGRIDPQRGIGTFGHMRRIARTEGLAGLWKGNLTRMAKVAPACAIMISCYEFGKRVFGDAL